MDISVSKKNIRKKVVDCSNGNCWACVDIEYVNSAQSIFTFANNFPVAGIQIQFDNIDNIMTKQNFMLLI